MCTPIITAASWGFEDATISVHGKKAGVGGGLKEKYVALSWSSIGLTD